MQKAPQPPGLSPLPATISRYKKDIVRQYLCYEYSRRAFFELHPMAGNAMARQKVSRTGRCQGCKHPQRARIERLLADGASIKGAFGACALAAVWTDVPACRVIRSISLQDGASESLARISMCPQGLFNQFGDWSACLRPPDCSLFDQGRFRCHTLHSTIGVQPPPGVSCA
jgi:hypothetical protein